MSSYVIKRNVLRLREFLAERGLGEKAIAIEEIGLSSHEFDEAVRAETFLKWSNIASELDVPIFLWWVLRDVSHDPDATDGDRISVEAHRWGLFHDDGSPKEVSTAVSEHIGREATALTFLNEGGGG